MLHLNALEEEGEREKFFEEHGITIHWKHESREVVVNLPLDRIEESSALFQPHVFPFPEAAGELAAAGV